MKVTPYVSGIFALNIVYIFCVQFVSPVFEAFVPVYFVKLAQKYILFIHPCVGSLLTLRRIVTVARRPLLCVTLVILTGVRRHQMRVEKVYIFGNRCHYGRVETVYILNNRCRLPIRKSYCNFGAFIPRDLI